MVTVRLSNSMVLSLIDTTESLQALSKLRTYIYLLVQASDLQAVQDSFSSNTQITY